MNNIACIDMGETEGGGVIFRTTVILIFTVVLFCLLFRKSEGLSGRTLRKLPFLAHALYIQVSL